MKRCYVVTGPESTGNRLLGAVLIRAGCEGKVRGPYPTTEDPYCLIRSFRHGDFDLRHALQHLRQHDYDTTILMPVRHPLAMLRSQDARGHTDRYGDGAYAARAGYSRTIRLANDWALPWWLVPYESLEDGADALCELLGLAPGTGPLPVLSSGFADAPGNENAKHW